MSTLVWFSEGLIHTIEGGDHEECVLKTISEELAVDSRKVSNVPQEKDSLETVEKRMLACWQDIANVYIVVRIPHIVRRWSTYYASCSTKNPAVRCGNQMYGFELFEADV